MVVCIYIYTSGPTFHLPGLYVRLEEPSGSLPRSVGEPRAARWDAGAGLGESSAGSASTPGSRAG